MLLSTLGHGGTGGAVLMRELVGMTSYPVAVAVATGLQVALLAPFARYLLKMADSVGTLIDSLDWKKKHTDPVIADNEPVMIHEPAMTPKQSADDSGFRSWLDANGFDAVTIESVSAGNSVDTYELLLPARMRAKQLIECQGDISRFFGGAIVRIEPVVQGKKTVSVEVARAKRSFVEWSDVVRSREFSDVVNAGGLPVVVGQDKTGNNVVLDMRELFHLLIAGRTGAGKSVGLNSIIMGLAHLSPKRLKMVMIDPKIVELAPYKALPHLITAPITDLTAATKALASMCRHMESRYSAMEKAGVRNIAEYNAVLKKRGQPELPYIVVIADEFGDMVLEETVNKRMQDKEQATEMTFRECIQRLAQKARASGIHLILTTQRPDAKVFDGLIKANVPSRICYQVADGINSRIVLDQTGAEDLLDRGDCLVKTPAAQYLTRCQSANISTATVQAEIVRLSASYQND
jgi:S-DNA-T family DNA segregation ATPase FtsK/SpoIIIE